MKKGMSLINHNKIKLGRFFFIFLPESLNFLKYKSLGVSIFLINKYFINFPIAYSFSLINTENKLKGNIEKLRKLN
jgi:hypothetical protein